MRFRLWLPLLQTIVTLLILGVPCSRETACKIWNPTPGKAAMDWIEGMNLPAVSVVAPVEFGIRKGDALPNDKLRFYGFWLMGWLCWYMVGRFVEDLVRWRRNKSLPLKNRVDIAFALLALPSAILLEVASANDGAVMALWGKTWVILTSAAFLFRVSQLIKYRRKPVLH
jgi:hypothetical protein